jgi:hypothetical protein
MNHAQKRFFDMLIDTILANIADGKKKEAAKLLEIGAELVEATKMGKKPMQFY